MDPIRLSLAVVVESLENQAVLVEALFSPEVSLLRGDADRALEALARGLEQVLKGFPRETYFRRQGATDAVVERLPIVLHPPKGSVAWREDVTLEVRIVRWNHGNEAAIARVPILEVEVLASTPEELAERLADEVRAALLRAKHAGSLRNLVWLSRVRRIRVEKLALEIPLDSLKQTAIAAETEKHEPPEKVLNEVGTNLVRARPPRAFEVAPLVERLAESLSGRQPKSVLLVGPSGVGKTALVFQLVRRRRHLGMTRTPFWSTSGSRLVAGMSGFGMWQERCQRLWRAASKLQAVLHLGNLVELMEVGKSQSSGQSIAGFLRPYLARGDLLAIAECTPEQWTVIERTDPHLLDVFQRIDVPEPTPEAGRKILSQFARHYLEDNAAASDRDSIAPAALDTLDRLHRRYASYSAYPGRPLRFLRNLLHERLSVVKQDGVWRPIGDVPPGERPRIAPGGVTAAFARETGLPQSLVDDDEILDLEGARAWFAARVIGQPGVVNLVVDLLATIKAGLARPRRPLASLLFIGPTGVGKTEMAKSLAEYLFGDAHRLTRFDMSEYGDRLSVSRLIGGVFGAEGLLTSKVREQPFSVVLFDEFEKAHGSFGDLLLQVLGEARLTDAGGRLADFTNAVIILTSNLGAADFQQGAIGYGNEAGRDAGEHFEQAVRQFVRPELYNRFDRIVPFAPLGAEVVRQIASRQLAELRKRDGLKYREVALTLPEEVAGHLAARGFDPRYGARPLKRAIERELLAGLAAQMNEYGIDLPLEVQVSLAEGNVTSTVRAKTGKRGAALPASEDVLIRVADSVVALRRETHRLTTCPVAVELANDLFRLEQAAERLARREARRASKPRYDRDGKPIRPRRSGEEDLSRLHALKHLSNRLAGLSREVLELEEKSLLTLYGQTEEEETSASTADLSRRCEAAQATWNELLMALYLRQFPTPDRVTLVLYSEDALALRDLARAYLETARGGRVRMQVFQYTTERADKIYEVLRLGEKEPALWRLPIEDPDDFLAKPKWGLVGLVMQLRGEGVFLRFGPEQGTHVFKRHEEETNVLVQSTDEEKYLPPAGVERRGAAGVEWAQLSAGVRRTYDLAREEFQDPRLQRPLSWFNRGLPAALADAMDLALWEFAKGILAR